MLSKIREFSKSIYAKVFLIIIAIPFIFWGMGPVFNSGSKNVIVEIDNDKITIQEFGNFINKYTPLNTELNKNLINQLLTNFISEKVIEKEIKYFNIQLSNDSLKKIIINNDEFKRENKFSRTEYEKYLIKNNTNAVLYEAGIIKQNKKKQLLSLIGGGVDPSLPLVNLDYNKINQKRSIELIDLNNFLINKIDIKNQEIEKYYESNLQKYKIIEKKIKFNKINPQNLIGNTEFDSLFFEKIDEIENLIADGQNVTDISKQYNLKTPIEKKFSRSDFQKEEKYGIEFTNELVNLIFQIEESQPTILEEKDNEYLIIELIKTEEIINSTNNPVVKKDILAVLEKQGKIKVLSNIATRVNNKTFLKKDFDNFSKKENSVIKKLIIKNLNNDKNLNKNFISEIYKLPKSGLMVITDPNITQNYLVFVSDVEDSYINKDSKDYDKYLNLTKVKFASSIYNTYDLYLKDKYKIVINYKALKSIKNYTE